MFKKLLPLVALAFITACATPAPAPCECCQKAAAECACCKDGMCDKCKGMKGKKGKQCPPKEEHKH